MGVDPSAFVHPKAHVEQSTIGARTRVWQFASVIRGAILGDDCNVASGATIDGARVGHRCIVSHNVLLPPGVVLSDDVFVGPGAIICNDRWPSTDKHGFNLDMLRRKWTVLVGNGVSIGANAVVLPGTTIGHGAMVAAGAVVNKSVPEGHLWRRCGSVVKIDNRPRQRMHFVDMRLAHAG